jgi:dihydrofolate reductase
MLNIIASMTKNGVIGLDYTIPWNIPEELAHFKDVTMGRPIIMGRTTYEFIKRPLPDSENIVLSSKLKPIKDITIIDNLEDAIAIAEKHNPDIFIIGGERVYQDTIDIADRLYLSVINKDYYGNKFFPKFEKEDWRIIAYNEYKDFDFFIYERKRWRE